MLWGAHATTGIEGLEQEIGREVAIVHDYTQWSSTFPTPYEQSEAAGGRILYVDWTARNYSTGGPAATWAQIAAGDQDAEINAEANALKAFGQPIMVSFMGEPEQGVYAKQGYGGPSDYVAAWQHIHDLFAADGVTNVVWVWDVVGDPGSHDYSQWYPGDSYVDWIMWDPYNWYGCNGNSAPWRSFSQIVSPMYDWLTQNSGTPGNGEYLSKPWGLAEFGTVEGPTATSKEQWFEDAVSNAQSQFPQLKALVYFDSIDTTNGRDCNWTVDSSADALAGYTAAGDEPYVSTMWTPGTGTTTTTAPSTTTTTVPVSSTTTTTAPSTTTTTVPVSSTTTTTVPASTTTTLPVSSTTTTLPTTSTTTTLPTTTTTTAPGGQPPIAPKVEVNPKSVAEPVGERVEFRTEASGTPAPTVVWQLRKPGTTGWTTLRQHTNPDYTILSINKSENGFRFRAVYKNSAGRAWTSAAQLIVLPSSKKPQVTEQPRSVRTTVGKTVRFATDAVGQPKPSPVWEVSQDNGLAWSVLTQAKNPVYTLRHVSLSDNGLEFRARYSNSAGSTFSAAARLVVTQPPLSPKVIEQPRSVRAALGSRVSFAAAAMGRPKPRCSWEVSRDGGRVWRWLHVTKRVYTIRSLKRADNELELRAVFRNGHGSVLTREAKLIVLARSPAPGQPRVTEQPRSVTVFAGVGASFSAAAVARPRPGVRWQISRSGGRSWRWMRCTNHVFHIRHLTGADNGLEVRAVFRNRHGVAYTRIARVTVVSSLMSPSEGARSAHLTRG